MAGEHVRTRGMRVLVRDFLPPPPPPTITFLLLLLRSFPELLLLGQADFAGQRPLSRAQSTPLPNSKLNLVRVVWLGQPSRGRGVSTHHGAGQGRQGGGGHVMWAHR